MSKIGRELAWDFLRNHWQEFHERYEGGFLLTRLVKYTTENFASEERALEVEKFFKEHKSLGTERTVQQATETIRLNCAWLRRDLPTIQTYLDSF